MSAGGRLGWGFWIQWTVASALALSLGSTLGGLVGEGGDGAFGKLLGRFVGDNAGGSIVEALGFTVVGFVVGTGQWLALRRHVPHTAWWVLATTGGYSIVGLLAGTMGWLSDGETGWGLVGARDVAVRFAVGGTTAGMVVGGWIGFVDGALQWMVLRRYISLWYLAASATGEAAGSVTSFTLGVMAGTSIGDIPLAAEVFLAGGAVGGGVTGGLIVLLFNRIGPRAEVSRIVIEGGTGT